jgi:tetratricopeptide (TPR) repeat protein
MNTMKNTTRQRAVVCLCGAALLFASACATGGGSGADALSLDEAVEQSAAAIAGKLPPGTRVAIVAFEAENKNLAGYVMDELTGALVDGSLEVADRNNLDYVLKELNFQISGDVDDESAASVGKFLGAEYVITGQMVNAGTGYRYRLAAVNVESAIQEVSVRHTVRNDRDFRSLLAAVRDAKQVSREAKYAVTEDTKPRTAGTFLDRGIMFASRGDYDMAIEDYTEAIRLDPNLATAYFNRGYAYGEKRDYDRAIADYTQAIKLNPNDAMAYNNRGYAYYNKGDYDRAIADCNQAIKLDPNDAMPYYNRGNTYYNKGDYDRAIADYTQAIKLDPNYTWAYANRGEAYRMKRQYDAAIKDLSDAIRLDPNYSFAYASRGVAYSKKGQKTQAITDLEKAISLDPNDQWAKDCLREIRGW